MFKPAIRILLREEPSSFIEFMSASLLLPLKLLRSILVVPLNNESSRVLRFLWMRPGGNGRLWVLGEEVEGIGFRFKEFMGVCVV